MGSRVLEVGDCIVPAAFLKTDEPVVAILRKGKGALVNGIYNQARFISDVFDKVGPQFSILLTWQ